MYALKYQDYKIHNNTEIVKSFCRTRLTMQLQHRVTMLEKLL